MLPAVALVLALSLPAHAAGRSAKVRSLAQKVVVRTKWALRPLRHKLKPVQRFARRVGKDMGRAVRRGSERIARTRLARSHLGQFAAGLLIDGPRESWHAIKRNPKVFLYGLLATGALAVAGGAAGLPIHELLVGASTVAAGVEVFQIHQHEYKNTKGSVPRARVAGKMAWLPALVVGTAIGGAAVDSHSPGDAVSITTSAARLTLGGALRGFASGIVTGGDVPTSAVTAYQTWKDDQSTLRRR